MEDYVKRIAEAMERQTEMISKFMEIIEEEHAHSKAMAAEMDAHRAQMEAIREHVVADGELLKRNLGIK